MASPLLTSIHRLPEDRQLELTWTDGHRARFDFDWLRGWCPCAGCQGHETVRVHFRPPPGPVTPVEIQPVGNYAVSFVWSDGHTTGIYRFDFLRAICPCEECSARRDEDSIAK